MYFTPLGNGANSVHITDKQVRRGKKKLAGLLAKARKDPLTGQDARDAIPEIEADRRRPLARHTRLKNLLSLVVQEDEHCKWHVDFILKRVPEGWPDTVGTPVARPAQSEKQALRRAYQMISEFQLAEQLGIVGLPGHVVAAYQI